LKAVLAFYDRLLAGLALLSALAFGAVAFIIAYEVSTRWLGYRPPVWPQAISEYTMLYATLFGAPWILRRAEHVQVTTLAAVLPAGARTALSRAMSFIGMVVCLVVAWYALRVTLTAPGLEIRSFEMPKWVVYAPLPLGFLLMAIEFFRHTVHATLFAGEEIDYYSRRREA
jgi:C4-dicarboxylate transporter, DctQ subunit